MWVRPWSQVDRNGIGCLKSPIHSVHAFEWALSGAEWVFEFLVMFHLICTKTLSSRLNPRPQQDPCPLNPAIYIGITYGMVFWIRSTQWETQHYNRLDWNLPNNTNEIRDLILWNSFFLFFFFLFSSIIILLYPLEVIQYNTVGSHTI